MDAPEPTPLHMARRIGLRGPRAPPSVAGSGTPSITSSVSDMSHLHLTSEQDRDTSTSASDPESDAGVETDHHVLPPNFREIRARAAEQRRAHAEARVSSQEQDPPADEIPRLAINSIAEEPVVTETVSEPDSEATQEPLASPRPQPPLRAPMALPPFLGARASQLYETPQRAASESAAPESQALEVPMLSEPRPRAASQMSDHPPHTTRRPPPAPSAQSPNTQRSRRRESQRRLSLLRGQRREPNHSLLAALSTQGQTGPGVLLPSLYGSLSNEPAPTQLRPAGVSYGQHAHGRVGAPWQADTSLGVTSSDGHGYVHPRLSERILASGPSVTNLHPASSSVHMSPGAELRIQTAQLRHAHVQPGSVLFPAGITSALCTEAKARDAHMSRKFEENSALSFSWVIEDAALLADEVAHGSNAASGFGKSEAWKLQPLFGEERWRLELVRRPKVQTPQLHTPTKSSTASKKDVPHVLCLYLSYLGLMAMPISAELPTHVMIGIRPAQRVHKLPRSLNPSFLWRDFFSFTFQQDNDTVVFDRLPDLADVLADPDVAESNAFDLVVQITTGPSVLPECDVRGSSGISGMRLPFEAPEMASIPQGLLQGLKALVDDGSSGDLMITVLEKGFEQRPTQELAESVGLTTFIHPWPVGTPMPEFEDASDPDAYPPVFVRDRVLWAHSSILRERSDFFATMIDSQFSEGALHETQGSRGRTRDAWRRPYRILRIPCADFVTMYWFLRYMYTEEVELLKEEDVQGLALDDFWILNQPHPSAKPDFKWRLVEGVDDWDADIFPPMEEGQPPTLSEGHAQRLEDTRARAQEKSATAMDPHPHPPMLPVPPASALALYRLAHRYGVQPLCDLTMTHIMSVLTPHNAIHYLLCTALLSQIQDAIQEYIIQNWKAVSSSPEFEYCCDQVSTGEWGPLAGRSLLSLMRQLRQTNDTPST